MTALLVASTADAVYAKVSMLKSAQLCVEPLAGLPRRKSPRARVPGGSVAIAGRQTGVYPAESPGGWLLLGRTPLNVVDLSRGHFPIRPGDRLRFEPIDATGFRDRLGEPLGAAGLAE